MHLTDSEREQYELVVQDGLIVNKSSGKPFDTADANTHWGEAIFVMDPEGRIFASNYQDPGTFHHSSLSGGKDVASAGTIDVADGVLLRVGNQSGHYIPKQSLNSQFFDELESKGILISHLNKVERSGWSDSGSVLDGVTHGDMKKAENWQDGDYIPEDWDKFL